MCEQKSLIIISRWMAYAGGWDRSFKDLIRESEEITGTKFTKAPNFEKVMEARLKRIMNPPADRTIYMLRTYPFGELANTELNGETFSNYVGKMIWDEASERSDFTELYVAGLLESEVYTDKSGQVVGVIYKKRKAGG